MATKKQQSSETGNPKTKKRKQNLPDLETKVVEGKERPSPSKSKEPKIRDERTYIVREPTEQQQHRIGQLAPQAKVLWYMLAEAASKQEERKLKEREIFELVNKEGAQFKSKQAPWRLFQYYRPTLINMGVLTHD